jgi:hypothetical protein
MPLILMPAATDPLVLTLLGESRSLVVGGAGLPRISIDARAYEAVAHWRPTASPQLRRTVLLLASGLAATILLAALLPKRAWLAVLATALAWAIGLFVWTNRRETLLMRDDHAGIRWYLATQAQTLRIPIRPGEPVVPVVESTAHLRTLSPRIVIVRETATLELTLPAKAKVGLRPFQPANLVEP